MGSGLKVWGGWVLCERGRETHGQTHPVVHRSSRSVHDVRCTAERIGEQRDSHADLELSRF